LLNSNPDNRPTADECKLHPWFKKIEITVKNQEKEKNVRTKLIANEAKQKIMQNMNLTQKQLKMQKTAMTWIIKELHNKEFKLISKIFLDLDKDKSGTLTKDELILG